MSYLYYYLKHFTFPGYRLKLYYPPQVAGSSGLDEPARWSAGWGNIKREGCIMDEKTTRKIKRFWKMVIISDDDKCWEWTGSKSGFGYGTCKIDGVENGAHRIAYSLCRGEIPPGMCVCHSCDNPSCCNPNHLWIGTKADNCKDRAKKKRSGYQPTTMSKRNWRIIDFVKKHPEITYEVLGELNGVSKQRIQQIVRRAGILKQPQKSYKKGSYSTMTSDALAAIDEDVERRR